ncbi:hypothetical protein N9754_05000, partial [Flavobacteriaceae bacterium]|nr:hypothetical protein [Flavobacteriaceae bacterium]
SLRVFGFSFNILFSVFLMSYLMVTSKRIKFFKMMDKNVKFLSYFIIYSFGVGIFYVGLSLNFLDNFTKDLLTYSPFFIYLYLLQFVGVNMLKKIVIYSLTLTCFNLLFSFIFNKTIGSEDYNTYLLINSFTYILPIALIVMKKEFGKYQYYLLCLITLFFLINGNFFLSAKQIIIFVFLCVWYSYNNKRFRVLNFLLLAGLYFSSELIFTFFINYFEGDFIAFKFSQIFDLFSSSEVRSLAYSRTSMGNLIAEAITLFNYSLNEPFIFLFGKGFGAGIPDLYGYLGPWAGESGYALQDLSRNDFHKLHLPIYEIFLKSGLLGLFAYTYLLVKLFFVNEKYSVIYLILFLTVFYVNKEYLMLTLIFLKIAIETNTKKNISEFNLSTNQHL